MTYIKLYAYYALNLGDDLMVDALIKHFSKCLFYVEEEPKKTAPFLNNRNFMDKESYYKKYGRVCHILDILTFNISKGWFFKKFFKLLDRKLSCSVLIGGSLYMQQHRLEEEQIDKRIEWENRYFKNGPLFIIGANFGSYSTEYYKEAYEAYFKKCHGVSFRDMISKKIFSSLPQVQYAPDVVLSMDTNVQCCGNTNKVLVSVIDLSKKFNMSEYLDSYEEFIIGFCEEVISNGKTPILMSFCQQEGDEEAIERIQHKLSEKSLIAEKYYYRGDISQALQVVAEAEFILASRFHAMILALRFKKRFFSVAYDKKITNVLKDIGCEWFCDVKNINSITPKQIMECTQDFPDVDTYIEKAKEHFSQLKEYLEKIK